MLYKDCMKRNHEKKHNQTQTAGKLTGGQINRSVDLGKVEETIWLFQDGSSVSFLQSRNRKIAGFLPQPSGCGSVNAC